MGNEFDRLSTVALQKFRDTDKTRVLMGELESSGGSLDEPIGESESHNPPTRLDTIPDERQPSMDQVIEREEMRIRLQRIMENLDATDQKILYGHTVFEWTQKELAYQLGISQAAVSQREKALPDKIRKIFGT